MKDDYIYDIETYPNCFLLGAIHARSGTQYKFEVSTRRDDRRHFWAFIDYLKNNNGRMVGFNNIGFDYPVIHHFFNNINDWSVNDIYQKAQSIIDTPWDDRYRNNVWESDWIVDQMDLYKVHHFDNDAKRTSLKQLEFAMRMESVEDLPYKPGTVLTDVQIEHLSNYMMHDIQATLDFYNKSQEEVNFRYEMSDKLGINLTNHSDTNIGKEYFVKKLEDNGVMCYDRPDGGRKQVRTTPRKNLHLGPLILPKVNFETADLNRVKNWISSQVIEKTKGTFEDLTAELNGFTFVFGLGGIHGSVSNRHFKSTETYAIIDDDVESYYPFLAIKNKFFPAHLSTTYCSVSADLFEERIAVGKKTTIGKAIKLALNGTYGNSNSQFSPFYDPAYTMSVTINGQFLLCMFAEQLVKIPGLILIQANTDGITYYVPRAFLPLVEEIRTKWMAFTGLKLEMNEYRNMWIRDVNAYIAENMHYKKPEERLKRKNAFAYGKDLAWHQNHSAQIVARAAEHALVYGGNIREFINKHEDPFDFCILAKVPRNSKLTLGETEIQGTSRVFISKNGGPLFKHMPPTPAQLKKDANAPYRKMAICKGWLATECNHMRNFDWSALNREYYIQEAEKLVNPLK